MIINVCVKMALKCGLILCWFLTNIMYAYCVGDPLSNSFIKKDNTFEQSYGDENTASLPEGYAEKVDRLLSDYKAGKIQLEALNTFNNGLEEYYIFRAREIASAREFIHMSPHHVPYPFPLSNYSDEVIKFDNVQVFEFPGLKKHGNSSAYADETISVSRVKAKVVFKSDVILFTGNFEIYNSSYFFVYSLKNAAFTIYLDASWYGEASINNVLQFRAEELLHTYDSSYERSTEASEILSQHFNKALLNSFLPKLSAKVSQTFNGVYLSNNVKVLASLQKSVLSAIIESAIQYATAKGLDTFEVGAGVNAQSYKNIKVEGVLNFIDYKLINSSKEIPQSLSDLENLYDVIQLTYANEGEKQAFISFVVVNGRQEISKKFKIKSVQITISYKVLSVGGPYKVSRNKDMFHGSGFLIKFELDSFDPTYEPLITQIGDYVASVMEQTLGTA